MSETKDAQVDQVDYSAVSDDGSDPVFDYMTSRGWLFLEYADGTTGEAGIAAEDPVDERVYDPASALAVQAVRDIERIGYPAFMEAVESASGFTGEERFEGEE